MNYEIGVFLEDAVAIKKLSEIAENWKKESVLFDPKSYKPKLIDYILSPIIHLFFL